MDLGDGYGTNANQIVGSTGIFWAINATLEPKGSQVEVEPPGTT